MLSRILREPLVHFLAIGAILFVLNGWIGRHRVPESSRIVVSAGRIEHLAASFAQVWNRSPTDAELDGLIDDFVLEEILYREAIALGLDRDDTFVRRRLRQKMEFLNEGAVPSPTDADLEAYLAQHPGTFRVGSRITFDQIYFSRDRRGDAVETDAARMLARLQREPEAGDEGDPSLLEPSYRSIPIEEITGVFGEDFARRVAELEPGGWVGPIESSLGLHLVRIRERAGGRDPDLAEVRAAVEREWLAAKQLELEREWQARLRDRYTVTIERGGD